jgi:ABC-type transporter Mla subunit MlaD
MNGIEVGSVRDVRISGERKDKPVEVLVALNARYAPHIPNDALASLETEGVLGPTFVELDSSKANGAPVQDNCLLQSVDPDNNATAHFLEVVGNALLKEADKLREKGAQPRSGDK